MATNSAEKLKDQPEKEPSMEEILNSIRKIINTDDDEEDNLSDQPESEETELEILENDDDDVLELDQMVRNDGTIIDLRNEDNDVVLETVVEESSVEEISQTDRLDEENPADAVADDNQALDGLDDFILDDTDREETIDSVFDEPDLMEDVPEVSDESSVPEVSIDIPETFEEPVKVESEITVDDLEDDSLDDIEPEPVIINEVTEEPSLADFEDEAAVDEGDSMVDVETVDKKEDDSPLLSNEATMIAANALSSLKNILNSHTINSDTKVSSDNTLEDIVKSLLKPLLKQWLDDNLPKMVEDKVAQEIARITGQND